MKKSDDHQNEELRRLFSGKFDGFGREPGDRTWSRIRAAIPSREPWYANQFVRRSAVLALLLGLTVSGWLVVRYVGSTGPDGVSESTLVAGTATQKAAQSGEKAMPLIPYSPRRTERKREPLPPAQPVSAQAQESHTNSTLEKSLGETEQTASVDGDKPLIRKEFNRQRRLVSPLEANELVPRRTAPDTYAKKGKRNRLVKTLRLAPENSIGQAVSSPGGSAQLTDNQPERTLDVIDKLTPKPASFGQLPMLARSIDWETKTEPVVRTKRTDWRLTGDVMPLYTYQRLTTRNVPETYVQNFQTPSAFSGETAGVKLALGVARAQWKAQLTFTRMKRWAYYEIATDEYRVIPIDQNSSLVVRQGVPVAESTTLNLAGLRISRAYKFLDNRRWQISVNGGAEGAWSFTTQQGLLFLTGSAVAAYKVSNQTRLRLAPTIDVGLTPLRDANNLLHIQPYTVGLAVGIETRLTGKR